MTEDRAVDLAIEAAKAAGASLEDYLPPTARLHEGRWTVLFQEKAMRVGGFVMAIIDDSSGKVRLVAGR